MVVLKFGGDHRVYLMTKPVPINVQAKVRPELPDLRYPPRRRRGLPIRSLLMVGGVMVVAVLAGWAWLSGGRYVVVDDAYVRAAKLMVSTDVSGIVSSVDVREGSRVKRNDVLFRLRPRQFQIELDNAKATLDQTVLSINAMKLDYRRLLNAIAAQQAQVDLAKTRFDRYQQLVAKKAVSQAVFDQARFALMASQKTLNALEQEAGVQLAKLGGNPDIPVERHPRYRQSRSLVDEAQRKLNAAVVRAPFDGVVTKVEALQPGTYLVAPTAAITNMGAVALVATDKVWIEANIKETDLTHVRPGNAVDITIDSYPGHIWRGTVDSISPASGAEFSILPAQNASGNWIKVTQRVPVRIAIEAKPEDPILRAGMSAVVSVDTGHRRELSDIVPAGWMR